MQINIFVILLILAFSISITLTVFIWFRKSDNVKSELFFVLAAISIWTLASALEGIFKSIDLKILFSKISYLGVVSSPVFFFFFVLRYTNLDKWITNKRKLFFIFFPVIILAFAATNELHGLVWPDVYIVQNSFAGTIAFYEHGPVYWLNILHSYLLLGLGTFILVFSIFRYKRLYSLQTRVLVLASLSPMIGNLIYSFSQSSLQGIDITPICFALTGLFLTFAISMYQFLDITPVSKEDITENLYDGVIILNKNNTLVDINKAACELLNLSNMDIGKPLHSILSDHDEILSFIIDADPKKKIVKEVPLPKNRHLELSLTTILDRYKNKSAVIMIIRDITVKKEYERKITESQNLLSNIIDFLPDSTFAINIEGKVIAWNKAMEKLTGMKKEEVIGKGNYIYSIPIYGERRPALLDMVLNEDKGLVDKYDHVEKEGNNYTAEIILSHSEKQLHLWLAATPLYNSNNEVIGAIESARNITDRKNIEKELRYISFHDSLTDLYNRAYFEEELKRLDQSRQLPLSIVMIDINGLKLVNDAFGHQTGDSLLKQATKIIKKSCRSEDIIARWGGDEFIILLPLTDTGEAKEIVDRIYINCKKASFKIPISLSLGSATKVNHLTRVSTVIKKAEDSMYKSKLLESKSVQNSIIKSLTKTLYEKSIETEYHSERVIRLSRKLGTKLGLPDSKLNELELHAKLHDIGKVAIDEKLLGKKTKLTEFEFEQIKKHSEIGFRIANSSTVLSSIAEYILCQHERWDGNGYPEG